MKRATSESLPENHEAAVPNWVENDDMNPMFNHVVVKRLFEVMPFNLEQFKNLRLVSKLFWKYSMSSWRQNAWLSINGRIYRSNDSCPYIEEYLAMLEKPNDPYQLLGKYKFQKYHLTDWDFKFGAGSRINRKKLEFWSKVGNKMTHLRCSNSVFHEREDFQRVIFELTPKLQFLSLKSNVYKCGQPRGPGELDYCDVPPVWNEEMRPSAQEIRGNLSEVEISLELSWKRRGKSDFPLCWLYFFSRFPNVKVLKLQNLSPIMPEHSYRELTKLFQCVEILREKCGSQILAQLQELDILTVRLRAIEELPESFTAHLRRLAFPLTSLAFDIGFDDEENEDKFKEILEIHSNTLEKLVVYQGPFMNSMPVDFPFGVLLPHLTELRLIGVCGNPYFLQDTPNLKTLVIMDGLNPNDSAMEMLNDYDDFSMRYLHQKHVPGLRVDPYGCSFLPLDDLMELDDLVLPKLEVFITSCYLCPDDVVVKMTKVMPNLKKLAVGLSNRGFRIACQKWMELEALSCDPFNVEDFTFLGYGIKDRTNYRLPNITDLSRLKYLSIGGNCWNKGLSNDSVLHGVLALPNLEEVSFKLVPDMTPDVQEMLISKFPRLRSQLCSDEDESDGSSFENNDS